MGYSSEQHIKIQEEIFSTIIQAEEGELSHIDALIELRKHKARFEDSLLIIKEHEVKFFDEIVTDTAQYPEGYNGCLFEIRNGRKTFNYKDIPAWVKADKAKKEVEGFYKTMFEAKQKGSVNANITEDGEVLPLPSLSYAKSSITVKQKK